MDSLLENAGYVLLANKGLGVVGCICLLPSPELPQGSMLTLPVQSASFAM